MTCLATKIPYVIHLFSQYRFDMLRSISLWHLYYYNLSYVQLV